MNAKGLSSLRSLTIVSLATLLLSGCQGRAVEVSATIMPVVPASSTAPTLAASPAIVPTVSAPASAAWCRSLTIDWAEGVRGKPGDPVDLARAAIAGLQAGDVVERGDPAEAGAVRIVRAGEVVGTLTYVADGSGGWLWTGGRLCGGLSIKP